MRRYDGGVGRGARGLGGNVPLSARAAPGFRPGTLGSPARSSLTAGRCGLPEAAKATALEARPFASQGRTKRKVRKRGPAPERTPPWSAERRPRPAFRFAQTAQACLR